MTCNWWPWHRKRPAPIDLSKLDAITRRANRVTRSYDYLLPRHQEKKTMTTPNPQQSEVDADVAQLTADFTTLVNLLPQIQGAIAALPQGIDTSALTALVRQGNEVAANYGELAASAPGPVRGPDPTPTADPPADDPTPTPDPTPAPDDAGA